MSSLIAFIWSSPSYKPRELSEKINYVVPPPGIEPAIPCFPERRSNQSDIETIIALLLKLLLSFLRYYQ